MIYTTEQCIASVKRRTLAPSSQKTFLDSDILSFLNEEMAMKIVPQIVSVREDYFLTSKQSSIVANVADYPIAERAIGVALKDVFWVQSNGTDKTNLARRQLTDSIEYLSNFGSPSGYFIKGDQITLMPTPSSAQGSVEQWYLQRPSELVMTTSCAKIVSVSSGGGTSTFTVDTDLTSSLIVGDTVDFLNVESPTVLWGQDVVITAITSSTIAVATSSVDDASGAVLPAADDYICPAKQANIPMVPQEFNPLLCEYVASRIVQALGHNDKLSAIQASIAEMKSNIFKLISNRVENDPRPVINRAGIFAYTTDFNTVQGRGRF